MMTIYEALIHSGMRNVKEVLSYLWEFEYKDKQYKLFSDNSLDMVFTLYVKQEDKWVTIFTRANYRTCMKKIKNK